MNKLLSCRYNMDTNRVEARFEGGTTLAIDCIAVQMSFLYCIQFYNKKQDFLYDKQKYPADSF